jgi:hypothetical protein
MPRILFLSRRSVLSPARSLTPGRILLLADEGRDDVVDSISHERAKAIEKNEIKLWLETRWCIGKDDK